MRCALILLGALLACGCGSKLCTPGASATCTDTSLGCVGSHVCNEDGTAFGTCDCGAAWVAPCNMVTQEGCPSGKRCGWIVDTQTHATTGCVPIGSVEALQPCTRGAFGASTGFDDCRAGSVCINGECRSVCRTSPSTCIGDFSCQRYTGLDDGSGNVGVCEPSCDPVTQNRLFDDAPACGSPNPAVPTRGCYGMPSSATEPTQFTCAPAGDPSKTHRVAAADAPGSPYFLNSCAPGYAPFLPRSSTDGAAVCIAFCSPAESYLGSIAQIQGVLPHTCPARGASNATEECRYFWFLENPRSALTRYSNTVGFCLDTSLYTWDNDNVASTPEVPFPSCATLLNTDGNNNGFPDNLEWACAPRP